MHATKVNYRYRLLWPALIVLVISHFSACQTVTDWAPSREEVTKLLDNWHKAAAGADTNVYFGSMSEGAVFLGTDANERWRKDEFYTFAKPHFDKGDAWDFKPYNRHIIFSGDSTIAWFDELLETWMGVCRGSGVVVYEEEGWRIAHYDLAIMVPNEKINDFIELMGQEE